jgi:hypothetical protein
MDEISTLTRKRRSRRLTSKSEASLEIPSQEEIAFSKEESLDKIQGEMLKIEEALDLMRDIRTQIERAYYSLFSSSLER